MDGTKCAFIAANELQMSYLADITTPIPSVKYRRDLLG